MGHRPYFTHDGMTMRILDKISTLARRLRMETRALTLAARHPATPWYVKGLVVVIVAYALSPIALIPDFVPILGYVDDLVLLPLALALAVRLTPPTVLAECRERARKEANDPQPASRVAAAVIVAVWLTVGVLLMMVLVQSLHAASRVPGQPA